MIVTPASIAYGFLSLLALVLSSGLVVLAAQRLQVDESRADRGGALTLALALGHAVLVLRVLAWPVLYVMFASYVGIVRGSMCVYGVTQAMPGVTLALQLVEPAAFLVSGATLALLGAYRAGATVRPRRLLAHLALAAGLSLVASLIGLTFLLAPKPVQEVSWCSAVAESPAAAGPSGFLLPESTGRVVLSLTQSLALALLLVQLWHLAQPSRRRVLLSAPIALAHVAAAVVALFGPIAPVITGLRAHHCAYCLASPRHAPYGLGLIGFLLLALSTAMPIWLAWLALATGEDESPRARRWRAVGVLALIAFWSLVLSAYFLTPLPSAR
jgi:hypothetical protein